MNSYKPLIQVAILGIIVLFFPVSDVLAARKEAPNLFAHNSTFIESDQVVENLMVAGGDVNISGQVLKRIIVVDGNLTVGDKATVGGRIIVLGGDVNIGQGAAVKMNPWVIAPQGHPLVPIMVVVFLGLGMLSFIILPVLFFAIWLLFQKSPWYLSIRKSLFSIEQKWPFLYIAMNLFISGLMLVLFSALAWKTLFSHTLILFDDSFIWLIRYFSNPYLDKIMIIISDMGFGTSYILIVGLTFLVLAYAKHWREMGAVALCLGGGGVLSSLLKNLFHRARPDSFWVVTETGFSFPSGHALATMCFYGMISFLIMRTITSWRRRMFVTSLTIAMVIAVGVSRIYLGVHYPTDVAAGYAIGSMWLAFCVSLLMWWER